MWPVLPSPPRRPQESGAAGVVYINDGEWVSTLNPARLAFAVTIPTVNVYGSSGAERVVNVGRSSPARRMVVPLRPSMVLKAICAAY